jgi:aspartate/methionine/tyrosine aminotransferase
MKIDTFGVEMWMNEWETKCELNLAETCVESLTIKQLLEITGRNEADLSALLHLKMTYGEIKGSDRLRAAVASLYSKQNDTNILITHGTIGANMLVHKTLIERGDRVISIVPTYQQHYSIPKSIGAEMELLHLREEMGWLPDLEKLKKTRRIRC